MKAPKSISGLDTTTIEGRLLMAAMCMLTTGQFSTKEPDTVLGEINDLQERMYEKETPAQINANFKAQAYSIFYVNAYVMCACLVSGFVFMKMWAWFIAPAFHIPELTFAASVGLYFFIKTTIGVVLVSEDKLSKEKKAENLRSFFTDFGKRVAMSAMLLCVAYILHLIVG